MHGWWWSEGGDGGGLGNSTDGGSQKALGPVDWAVIVVHLGLSIVVGLLATRHSSKDGEVGAEEFFLAGRSQGGCTVAVSLVSGMMSGISFLGGPAYAYTDGAAMGVGYLVAMAASAPISAHVIIPFYHGLELTTVYEYLELRYCRAIRNVAAIIFTVKTTVYLGMVLYAPALVISTLTPLPVWGSILGTGTLATLWTIKGGMLAVIWTDFMQSIAMFGVAIIALFFAVSKCGGVAEVYGTLDSADRLIPGYYFGWHPYTPSGPRGDVPREDFWSLAVGVMFANMAQGFTDQLAVQRWLTISNVRAAKVGVYQSTALQMLMMGLMSGIGMSIYAYYTSGGREDPVPHILDGNSDRIFPHFVIEVLPDGVAGLLIAAILGSTMSVFSGGLNASATSIYIDLIDNALGRGVAADRVVAVNRKLTVALAIVSIVLAFLAAQIAGLVKQAVSLMGLALGPLLGLNLAGMLLSRPNWQGGTIGLAVGIAMALWLGTGSAICPPTTVTAAECPTGLGIGRITFFWFGAITCCVTFAATLLGSLPFPAPPAESLRGLCIWHPKRSAELVKKKTRTRNPSHVSSESAALLEGIQ